MPRIRPSRHHFVVQPNSGAEAQRNIPLTAFIEFEKWALGFAGCDGGDIGSPHSPSVWICGIEWGGSWDSARLLKHMGEDVQTPPKGYQSWEENISYIFNWQVMKLLAAMRGNLVSQYKQFAEVEKPFVSDAVGYFKMNLYPIPFRNTSLNNWQHDELKKNTGFSSKNEYIAWNKEKRFPQISTWVKTYLPKLVICLGITYREEFASAFSVNKWKKETIDEKELHWATNEHGTLVVVVPFMVNRYGLVRNLSIQKFGGRIARLP